MHSLLPLLVLALACRPDKADDDTSSIAVEAFSDCDPIAPTLCGLPFPSTFYMREDASSPTGWRVALGETTLPIDANGHQPTPERWNERDGWSPVPLLLAHFPGATLDGTVSHLDLAAFADADAKTVVIDVETGERAVHFVELDMVGDDDDRRLLMIRVVEPLDYGHRYVVGIRGLVDDAGVTMAASDGFAALRDGEASDSWDIEGRRDLYDDLIFPTLEADGWDRGEVQLAWDFVVGSEEGITGRARFMRDDALGWVEDNGVAYEVTEVETFTSDENANTAFRVHGTMTVPLYTEEDGPGTLLTRGEDNMPYRNGTTTVPFTVVVPRTLVDEPRPAPVVQYGHGLLGGQDEVHAGYLADMANRHGWILFAVDWTGMKSEDVVEITLMIATGLERFAMIPERSMQGFVEFLCAMRLVTDTLVSDEHFLVDDPESGDTVAIIDPERRFYYGNSQGGVVGGAYVALSQDIERAALGVGGMPYSLLLDRSHDFHPFLLMFQSMYPDPAHIALWLGYMQALWDSGEAAGYGLAVNSSPLPDTPSKDVLLFVAVGDAQVSTLGAHVMARAYGAKLVDEPVRPVYGLETAASGFAGSALVEWDYGLEEPVTNTPPEGDDPHEWPRREEASFSQLKSFFEDGEVVNYCDGACFSSHD